MSNNSKFALFLSSVFILTNSNIAFARSNDIDFKNAPVIRSSERCPTSDQDSKMLRCSSYRQTTSYTCGPAAVMSLLRYYGRISSGEMNQKTELRIAAEMGGDTSGASIYQVSDWLSSHGFSVDSGQRATADMLIDNIKHGVPTLLSYSRHWILAKGYKKGASPEDDTIIFSDSCCNTTVMTRATIDSAWAIAQNPSNKCFGDGQYIAARPR